MKVAHFTVQNIMNLHSNFQSQTVFLGRDIWFPVSVTLGGTEMGVSDLWASLLYNLRNSFQTSELDTLSYATFSDIT